MSDAEHEEVEAIKESDLRKSSGEGPPLYDHGT